MREACPWMPSGWPAGRVRKPQVCSFAMGSITSYLGQQAELALKPWLPPESVCPALPPAQGPRGGQTPAPSCTPAPCCRPCLLSASPARACTTPPAALLPTSLPPGNMPISLLHPALAVVHCAGVQAREAERLPGACLDPEISVSPLIRALGRLPPSPTWPQPP